MFLRYLLISLMSFFIVASSIEGAQKQTICLNMIVKNESEVICTCLNSVKSLIDYWVIVDTGSTDGTQEVIKNFMKDIPGEIHERPWVNFGHNRSEALVLAKDKADYVLIMDADDFLVFSNDFVLPYLDKGSYFFLIDDINKQYYRRQLIKNSLGWRWEGVLHEYLALDTYTSDATLENVVYRRTSGGARTKDPLKFQKDAQILEKALETDPNNSRYVFYLAQSYHAYGNYEKAIENYNKRVAMKGWNEEVFYSLLQIAIIRENQGLSETVVSDSYYKAYLYRPSRAEPLYYLASYYRKKRNFSAGYYVAQQGLTIPPSRDILFVEQWVSNYGMLFEYSVCAYWVGEYKKAEKACFDLLSNPFLPQAYRETTEYNLAWVESKLGKH